MSEPESESPPLDAEDWHIVFEAYVEYPILAFILAQHLACIKTFIQRGPKGRMAATATLDLAIESLCPYTTVGEAGREMYLLAVAGTLTTEQEDLIRELVLMPTDEQEPPVDDL